MLKKLSKKLSLLFACSTISVVAIAAMTVSCGTTISSSNNSICEIDVVLDTKWNDDELIAKYDEAYTVLRNQNNYLVKNTLTGADSRDRVLISLSDGPFYDRNAETNWMTDNTNPGDENYDPIILDQRSSSNDAYDTIDLKDVEYYSFIQMQNFIMTSEVQATDFSSELDASGAFIEYTEKRPRFEAEVMDYKTLHEINQLNIAKLDKVVQYFKSQNKKVYLVGKGYGGNLLAHYLIRYYDKMVNESSIYVHGVTIGGAKINMDSWYLETLKDNFDDRLIEKYTTSTDASGNISQTFDRFVVRSEIEDAIETVGFQRRWRWFYSLEEKYVETEDTKNESSFIMNDYASLMNYYQDRPFLWNGDVEYDDNGKTINRIGISDEVQKIIDDFEIVKEDVHHPDYAKMKKKAEAAEYLKNVFSNSKYLIKKINTQRLRYSLYTLSTTSQWKNDNISYLNKGVFFVQGTRDNVIMNYTDSEYRTLRDIRVNTLTLEEANHDLMLTYKTSDGVVTNRNKLNGLGHMTRRMLNSSLSNKEANFGSWRLSINNKQLSALKILPIN